MSVTFVAWIFSVVAVSSCEFMVRPYKSNSDYDFYVGLFGIKGPDNDCESWSDWNNVKEDSAIDAGRAFGVITSLFGSIVMVVMFVGFFIAYPLVVWKVVMIVLYVLCVFQIITLSALGTDLCTSSNSYYEDCVPAAGGACTIVATFLWLASAILVTKMPVSTNTTIIKCCKGNTCCGSSLDQTSKPIESPVPTQGRTKTVIEEVITPDGTKTITTTVIPIDS